MNKKPLNNKKKSLEELQQELGDKIEELEIFTKINKVHFSPICDVPSNENNNGKTKIILPNKTDYGKLKILKDFLHKLCPKNIKEIDKACDSEQFERIKQIIKNSIYNEMKDFLQEGYKIRQENNLCSDKDYIKKHSIKILDQLGKEVYRIEFDIEELGVVRSNKNGFISSQGKDCVHISCFKNTDDRTVSNFVMYKKNDKRLDFRSLDDNYQQNEVPATQSDTPKYFDFATQVSGKEVQIYLDVVQEELKTRKEDLKEERKDQLEKNIINVMKKAQEAVGRYRNKQEDNKNIFNCNLCGLNLNCLNLCAKKM